MSKKEIKVFPRSLKYDFEPERLNVLNEHFPMWSALASKTKLHNALIKSGDVPAEDSELTTYYCGVFSPAANQEFCLGTHLETAAALYAFYVGLTKAKDSFLIKREGWVQTTFEQNPEISFSANMEIFRSRIRKMENQRIEVPEASREVALFTVVKFYRENNDATVFNAVHDENDPPLRLKFETDKRAREGRAHAEKLAKGHSLLWLMAAANNHIEEGDVVNGYYLSQLFFEKIVEKGYPVYLLDSITYNKLKTML